MRPKLVAYFATTPGAVYVDAVDATDNLIDGFQSPLGMEALATTDWLIQMESAEPTLAGIRKGLVNWRHSPEAATRKQNLFTDKLLVAALDRLNRTATTA